MSKAVEEDTSKHPKEPGISDSRPPTTEAGTAPEVKQEESNPSEDDDSIDETRDTTSRTSTRLVKFQLFETKVVLSLLSELSNISAFISSDLIKTKLITVSLKSIEQWSLEN